MSIQALHLSVQLAEFYEKFDEYYSNIPDKILYELFIKCDFNLSQVIIDYHGITQVLNYFNKDSQQLITNLYSRFIKSSFEQITDVKFKKYFYFFCKKTKNYFELCIEFQNIENNNQFKIVDFKSVNIKKEPILKLV